MYTIMTTQVEPQETKISKIEQICSWICEKTGSTTALVSVVVIQVLWLIIGQWTNLDAYPYPFFITISNIVQLTFIFIIAVGQRQFHKLQYEAMLKIVNKLDC
jgi:hypothetical protein